MQLKFLLLGLAFTGVSLQLKAQVSATTENSTIELNSSNIPSTNGDDWTFYLDSENKVYYIDFETISVNLSDLQVKNDKGDVVMKDDLWNLPVNAIYELDFTRLDPGSYEIQLRTYTGVIRKEVTISE